MQTRADRTQEQSFSSRARVKESQKEPVKDLDRQCHELLSQNRGRDACTLIARVLGSEVRGYCRGMMASESTGDDLYQDVLEAVLVGLPSFQFASSIRTWVYAIAHHLVLRRLRRYSRRKVVRLETGQADGLPGTDLRSQESREHRRELVMELRDRLAPEDREVIILRAERELSFRDIAVVLQTSEATARQRFHRARKQIEALLAEAE